VKGSVKGMAMVKAKERVKGRAMAQGREMGKGRETAKETVAELEMHRQQLKSRESRGRKEYILLSFSFYLLDYWLTKNDCGIEVNHLLVKKFRRET
jgi:hypothetical protein